MIKKNLEGQIFGKRLVLSRVENRSIWIVRCKCGTIDEVTQRSLLRGRANQCRPCSYTAKITHGHTRGPSGTKRGSPTYMSWTAMKDRCNRPRHKEYIHYGGRGIQVCERWADFQNFLDDLGERPLKTSLDRINVNGNYEPGNCRWSTVVEQLKNRRVFQSLHKYSDNEIREEFYKRNLQ